MTGTVRTIALIGATSGLGRPAADQLARDGHNLVLVGRDPKRVERLAKQLPTAVVICADVSIIAGIDHAATQIESAVDHLDALVNNAGVMIPTRQTTSEGAEMNFAVHHLAPYSKPRAAPFTATSRRHHLDPGVRRARRCADRLAHRPPWP